MMKRLFLLPAILTVAVMSARAADPVEFTVGAFTFERPETWGWVQPSSQMRKAQLSVPAVEGSAAGEVTFFHFGPGQGGTVEQNVTRWINQFSDGTSDTQTGQVGKTQVTFVKAAGTFSSGMPGGPTTPLAGYAMRGAILPSGGGDVYVKMTGPEAAVKAAEAAFEKMIRTAAGK